MDGQEQQQTPESLSRSITRLEDDADMHEVRIYNLETRLDRQRPRHQVRPGEVFFCVLLTLTVVADFWIRTRKGNENAPKHAVLAP